MLHELYWQVAGPALRALGPSVLLRASPILARPAGRLGTWPGVAAGVRRGFPDADAAFVARVARQDAQRRVRTAIERHILPGLDERCMRQRVRVSGHELLRGGPAIVVQAHFGVHGLPGVALARCGLPLAVHAVVLPDRDLPDGRRFSQRQRRALEESLPGIRYIYGTGPESLERCRAVLAEGGVLLGVPDGATSLELLPGPVRELPLLGHPARWPRYAFDLAERMDVPVRALFPDSSGPVQHMEVIALDAEDPQRDFVRRYDAMLRRLPGQWQFWEHFRPGAILAA